MTAPEPTAAEPTAGGIGTAGPEALGSAAAEPTGRRPPGEHDPARRAFFRELGRQAITTVGQVAALTDVMGRGTSAAATLLGVDLREPTRTPPRGASVSTPRATRAPGGQAPGAGTDDAYRSPYRLEGDVLRMLDQRRIPEALEELTCRRGTDVAYYLRIGACRGGPLMAQVAAYGMALTARERQDQPPAARRAETRRTRNALIGARPSSRLPGWAVGRMAEVEEGLGEEAEGRVVADALRAEAEAIAAGFQLEHAAITRILAERLSAIGEGGALTILVHGDPGALWGGLLGPGVAALTRLAEAGRELRVFVTETRPFLDGARLAAWELRQAGLAHQVIPDAAVAWLLDREPVDAVLLSAEWVAANGDVAAVVGARGVGLLAAGSGQPRAIALASSAIIDLAIADGSSIPTEMRPVRELGTFQHGMSATTASLNPATDVIPASALAAIVTERGVIAPVTGSAVRVGAGQRPEALHGARSPAEAAAT